MSNPKTPPKYRKKVNPHTKRTRLICRANNAEAQILVQNAFVHAGGNMSEWLREAGINYKPKARK